MRWDGNFFPKAFYLREKRPGYEDGELASEINNSLANKTRGKRQTL